MGLAEGTLASMARERTAALAASPSCGCTGDPAGSPMHKNKNQRRSGLSCWNTLPSCQGAITASRFPPAEHLTPHTSKKPSERRHRKKGTARGPSRGAARFPPGKNLR